ncbi:hypothetical protein [Dehalogenimonas etheniformans]|uniref:hypothetical protein n=1 Tax=Dehalogenimonas etheniformans TaxID=1536648 RepID=UPI0013923735|nr:hypothetical protein [Dehalogenimonas etheniformans]QNT75188.1 hypothetical protein HX448_03085 [Dehalogenimonas etheniformans]
MTKLVVDKTMANREVKTKMAGRKANRKSTLEVQRKEGQLFISLIVMTDYDSENDETIN